MTQPDEKNRAAEVERYAELGALEDEEALNAPIHGGDPKLSLHHEYVDNFVAMSRFTADSHAAMVLVAEKLRRQGWPVHEMSTNVSDTKVVGWRYSGKTGFFLPSGDRRWVVRLAVKAFLSKRRV